MVGTIITVGSAVFWVRGRKIVIWIWRSVPFSGSVAMVEFSSMRHVGVNFLLRVLKSRKGRRACNLCKRASAFGLGIGVKANACAHRMFVVNKQKTIINLILLSKSTMLELVLIAPEICTRVSCHFGTGLDV